MLREIGSDAKSDEMVGVEGNIVRELTARSD